MQIIESEKRGYEKWRAKNSDPYGRRCFTYAEQWAELMEERMARGQTLEQCADDTSHEADTDGITGFMYGMAVSILSKAWVHGEQLRHWHNLRTQIGSEGEEANAKGSVLNPALLRVGKKR
jgi:hypothetical protein